MHGVHMHTHMYNNYIFFVIKIFYANKQKAKEMEQFSLHLSKYPRDRMA